MSPESKVRERDMRAWALSALLLLSAASALAQPAGIPASRFPKPARPVARIISDRWSSEDTREHVGEALVVHGFGELAALVEQTCNETGYERVHVIGHSDRIGSAAGNVELSRKRAAAVRDYLAAAGVPADRITAQLAGK